MKNSYIILLLLTKTELVFKLQRELNASQLILNET